MNKVVVLAAGRGARMKNQTPKVLRPLARKPILKRLVESIIKSKIDSSPIIVVSRENIGLIKDVLKDFNCQYAIQKKLLGTGHALLSARNFISRADNVIVLCGDHPLIKPATIKNIVENHKHSITMMIVKVKNFASWRNIFYHWGRILRKDGKVQAIIEFKDATDDIKKLREVNPALYCFSGDWLRLNIKKLTNNNNQKEYYLTDLVHLAFLQGRSINSLIINPEEAIGINTPEELIVAEEIIK